MIILRTKSKCRVMERINKIHHLELKELRATQVLKIK